ncbi:hypothetical protein [Marinobacter daepoensis]|uniref:hypothetical protein n=1 Tax=Marinobacter daepoensis TaxID=262077 RepID=UPI000429D926|nr:hypothetical protein [Marinobacter daepoensis]
MKNKPNTKTSSQKNILENFRLNVQILSFLGLGIVLILLGSNAPEIHNFIVNDLGINKNSSLSELIESYLGEAKWVGWTILLSSIIVYFIAASIEKFFHTKISPIVTTHVDRLSEELNEVGTNTRRLLSAKLLDNLISASPRDEIRSKLKLIHERAYGPHCAHELGLYSAVSEKLSPFLEPETPHRSDYHQTVTVMENGKDSIIWHEVCSYKIHTICLEPGYENNEEEDSSTPEPKCIKHNVKFSSIVKVAELSFDGDNPKYQLSISVDHEEVFNSLKHLYLDGKTVKLKAEADGISVTHKGSTLEIRLNKEHTIDKPWTDIEIKETSTIYDDYFISSRNEPTCGAKITMNLPDNWSFELIRFGHSEDWTIHQHPTNTLSAWTTKWLMPGITFFCKWQRPEGQQLELVDEGSAEAETQG